MMNIVSEWKLDGGTVGNNAITANIVDTWSTNNATAVAGNLSIKGGTDCVIGNCLNFNGSSYINFGNIHNSTFSGNFSLSIWFKTDFNSSDWVTYLIEKGNGSLPYFAVGIRGSQYGATNSNKIVIRYNNDADLGASNKKYVDNNWHNVVIVRNLDAGTVIMYIDGVAESPFENLLYTGFASDLTVGSACGSRNFNGFIDEIRLYNAVVSAFQIKEQYYVGLNKMLNSGNMSREDYLTRINSIANE